MPRRPRRKFTAEFKAEAVALVKQSGKSVGQVAKELDLTETALREWVARIEAAAAPRGGLTESERDELNRLRKDFQRVQMERDFLKKAAVSSTGRRNVGSDRGDPDGTPTAGTH